MAMSFQKRYSILSFRSIDTVVWKLLTLSDSKYSITIDSITIDSIVNGLEMHQ